MKSERTGRRRHLRHSSFSRFRTDPSGVHRAIEPRFWDRRMTALTGTGTAVVFTATNAANTITIAAHGLADGDGPFLVSNAGGALPAGLDATTLYFVGVVDANTLNLHTPARQSIASSEVGFTDDGTGVQTLTKASDEEDAAEAGFQYNRQNRAETIEAATDVDAL